MDIKSDVSNKQCFKCDQKILGSLNIATNVSNSMTVLWNRHQILVFEEFSFNCAARIIEPEFQIFNLLLYNNYISCLDRSGNVHVISLKFKNPTQKRFKSSFQPRKQNILGIAQLHADFVVTLQYSINILYLSYHRINKEFQIEKELQLLYDEQLIRKKENCIFKCYSISESSLKNIKQLFDVKEYTNCNNLVVITFDKLTVYACLTSTKVMEDETKLVKIYSCPSEICKIELVEEEDIKIIIGLTIGTIIAITLKDRKPTIIHLNTAIHKYFISKNMLIYTDGCSMWKRENIFCKEPILNKLFVKQINDFLIINDKIICTTFANLIYMFDNNETSYLKANMVDYTPADKVINNSDCLNKIMEEMKKNNELVKKLSREENYITALSLSNRQDIMNNIIATKIVVYNKYEDALKEYVPMTLTEETQEYFKPETMLFLINICVNTSHNIFTSILSNLFTDLKIHISFSTENKLLKTTSIKLGEQLKIVNFLLPLKNISTKIHVNIVIVTNIPGIYDEKQTVWTVLYRKLFLLNSENFINTDVVDKVLHLKKAEPIEQLMLKATENYYGNLFKFTDISESSSEHEWSFYVKLPGIFPEILKNSDICSKYLNFKTAEFLSTNYTTEEFLKSKSNFVFMVQNEKVKLEVVNDGFSNPVLKITSENPRIAMDIRNFFARIIYYDFKDLDEEFISHTFYTTVEMLQMDMRNCIRKGLEPEEFISLADRFERNVIGALPI